MANSIISKRGYVLFQGSEVMLHEDANLITVQKDSQLLLYDRLGNLLQTYSGYYTWDSDGYFHSNHDCINIFGKKCPHLRDYDVVDYGEGLFRLRVFRNGRTVGYCNAEGKILIQCNYQDAGPFSEGLAPVKYNRKWGFINHKGDIVIDCIYSYGYNVPSFSNGIAELFLDGEKVLIDKKGKECKPVTQKPVPVYHDGLLAFEKQGLYGFVNEAGMIIIPTQYEHVGDFSEGLAYVENNDTVGFIDTCGQIAITLSQKQYPYLIPKFHNGLAEINCQIQYRIDARPVTLLSDVSHTGKAITSTGEKGDGSKALTARLIGIINVDNTRYAISIGGKNEGEPLYSITCKCYDRDMPSGYLVSKLVAESIELEAKKVSKPYYSRKRRMYVSVASFPCSLDDLYSLTHNDSVSISFGNQVDTLAIRLTEDDVNQLRAALDPEYKYTPVVVKENKTEGKKEKQEKQEKENVGTKKQIQSAIQRIKAINWNRDREKLKTLLQDPYSIAQIKRLNTLTTGEHAILSFVNGIKKKYNTSMLVQDIKRVEENERYNNKHTIIALFRSRDTTYSEELKRFLYDWHCAIGKKTYY